MLMNYHIVGFVLGSMCVGDLVQLDLSSLPVLLLSYEYTKVSQKLS